MLGPKAKNRTCDPAPAMKPASPHVSQGAAVWRGDQAHPEGVGDCERKSSRESDAASERKKGFHEQMLTMRTSPVVVLVKIIFMVRMRCLLVALRGNSLRPCAPCHPERARHQSCWYQTKGSGPIADPEPRC